MDDAEARALLSGPLRLGSGRRAKPIRASFKRELTVEDLLRSATQERGTTAPAIKELRQSHHFLARTLAQGVKDFEAAIICGYSASRISILKADPTFSELLAYYEAMEEKHYAVARADMHERLKSLGFDTIETLHQKLIDEPEAFTPKDLVMMMEATADRTGHGKQSTVNHEHSHSLSDEAIARIKSASSEGRPVAEADRQSLLRLATRRAAELHSEAQKGDWIEGSGTLVREESCEGDQEPTECRVVALPSVDPVPGSS
jgi:hypothetical protein